jgi:hypothetical protein
MNAPRVHARCSSSYGLVGRLPQQQHPPQLLPPGHVRRSVRVAVSARREGAPRRSSPCKVRHSKRPIFIGGSGDTPAPHISDRSDAVPERPGGCGRSRTVIGRKSNVPTIQRDWPITVAYSLSMFYSFCNRPKKASSHTVICVLRLAFLFGCNQTEKLRNCR